MSDHEDTSKDEVKAPATGADSDPPPADEDSNPPQAAGEDSDPPPAGEDSNPPCSDDLATKKETPSKNETETVVINGSDADLNEWKVKAENLADAVEEMEGFVYRTDISATEKVNQVKRLIDVAQKKPKEEPKQVENNKRPA